MLVELGTQYYDMNVKHIQYQQYYLYRETSADIEIGRKSTTALAASIRKFVTTDIPKIDVIACVR